MACKSSKTNNLDERVPFFSKVPFIERNAPETDIINPDTDTESYKFSQVPNFSWTEFSLLTNVFLCGFDGTITASTYSMIGNEFGDIYLASWITISYLVTATASQPLYGSLSDIFGRKTCVLL